MDNDHSLENSRYPSDVVSAFDGSASHPVDPSPGVFSLTDADDDGSHGNQLSDDGSGTNASHLGVVRTRRRKVSAEGSELRLCVVCEERATGYNFDRLTCESCKAFFRRNALKAKDKIKPCTRGGNCDVTGAARKHCPTCRLRKCFRMGMKKELILPPEKLELRAKPRRRVGNNTLSHELGSLPSVSSITNAALSMRSVAGSENSGGGMPMSQAHTPGLTNGPPFTYDMLSAVARLSENVGPPGMENHSVSANSFISPNGHIPTLPPSTQTGDGEGMGLSCLDHQSRPRMSLSPVTVPSVLNYLSRTNFTPEESLILNGLSECSKRLRDPFPQPPTGAGEESNWEPSTLEEMYNSMDMCIRRIIRVVKLLPFFSDIGKESQIQVLRANIYGLIVIHGSFFFDKDNRSWRYPLRVPTTGAERFITITMYSDSLDCRRRESPSQDSDSVTNSSSVKEPFLLREFRRYRGNLLHVNELLADLCTDDILLVALLALKLFNSDGALTSINVDGEKTPDETVLAWRRKVDETQDRYSTFLQHYLATMRGPVAGVRDYSRIILTLVDVRTLEVRMKEFAKFLSSEGLSPLMREVCHH